MVFTPCAFRGRESGGEACGTIAAMATVFLHNTSFTREHDALAFIEQLPQLAGEQWFWNIWKTGQKTFGLLENGSLVGLVVSWKGHRELAWLATASNVLTDSFDD